jgi:hypothetical protein
LIQWMDSNNLIVNGEKTKYMEFFLRFPHSDGAVVMGSFELEPSNETNFLGLTIDSNLKFSGQVEKVSKKLNCGIFILRRLAKFSSVDILMTAYYGCIYPHLSYALPIWGYEKTSTSCIFKLQKKALRVMFRLWPSTSCRGVFRSNRILTFPCMYILESTCLILKNSHMFKKPPSIYSLRPSNCLAIPPHSTTFYKKQVVYSSITLFNRLPTNLRIILDPKIFRSRVREFLIDKEYYSLDKYFSDKTIV